MKVMFEPLVQSSGADPARKINIYSTSAALGGLRKRHCALCVDQSGENFASTCGKCCSTSLLSMSVLILLHQADAALWINEYGVKRLSMLEYPCSFKFNC